MTRRSDGRSAKLERLDFQIAVFDERAIRSNVNVGEIAEREAIGRKSASR